MNKADSKASAAEIHTHWMKWESWSHKNLWTLPRICITVCNSISYRLSYNADEGHFKNLRDKTRPGLYCIPTFSPSSVWTGDKYNENSALSVLYSIAPSW